MYLISKYKWRVLIFLAVFIVLRLAVWWFYPSTSDPNNKFTLLQVSMSPPSTGGKTYKQYVLEDLDTVLLGGMSFIGSRLAVYLNGKVHNIRVMEDVINVDPDPLKWYRWGELNKLGIAQSIYDSDITNLSCNSLLIYVPTMYNGKINKDNKMWKPLHYYIQLKDMLIGLLNNKRSRGWIIILTYQYNDFNLQMAWINLLERLLINIVQNVDLNEDTTISVIKIGQVYGPWQDNLDTIHVPVNSLYIDELGTIVEQVLTKPESKIFDYMTLHADEAIGNTGVVETRKWLVEYKKLCEIPKKNIVTAAALKIRGSYKDQQYADHVKYIKRWYRSAMYFNLNALLFHNTIPESIQTRLKSVYKHIEFFNAEDYHHKFATDARFYILYDYLLTRPEIRFVITTDVKDVKFLNDPFKVIAGIGSQYLYVGHDYEQLLTEGSFDVDQLEHCYPNYKYTNETLQLAGFLNCGALGGNREVMLTMLSRMMLLFDTTKHKVCDMVTVSIVAHVYIYDLVYILYPFNNGYRNRGPGPHGLAIKHNPLAPDDPYYILGHSCCHNS